jgi:predicted hydrocarbon binding protein
LSAAGRFSPNSFKRMITALNSARFRDDTGTIEYFGQKVVILRRDMFQLIRRELSRVAGTAADVMLGLSGRRVGNEEGKVLLAKAQSLGLAKATAAATPDFIRMAVEETNMGYGKIRILELDAGSDSVAIGIMDCFEADSLGESLGPSCHFTLGYLEGLFSQLLGKNFRGRETSCRGRGDDSCNFQLRVQ